MLNVNMNCLIRIRNCKIVLEILKYMLSVKPHFNYKDIERLIVKDVKRYTIKTVIKSGLECLN